MKHLPSYRDNATNQGIFISEPDMGISAWNEGQDFAYVGGWEMPNTVRALSVCEVLRKYLKRFISLVYP